MADQDGRDMPFGGESVYYSYKCKDCGKKHEVEDIVVDAFLAGGKYEPGQMPMVNCPYCNGTLVYNG